MVITRAGQGGARGAFSASRRMRMWVRAGQGERSAHICECVCGSGRGRGSLQCMKAVLVGRWVHSVGHQFLFCKSARLKTGLEETETPLPKYLHVFLAKLDFAVHEWWEMDIRWQSYASWKLPGLSILETLVWDRRGQAGQCRDSLCQCLVGGWAHMLCQQRVHTGKWLEVEPCIP